MDGVNADIAGAIYRPPCPSHYAGHLATMPSADFCLITDMVTHIGAIGLTAKDGGNADIAGAIYLSSYLLKQFDEFCLPSLFKSVA